MFLLQREYNYECPTDISAEKMHVRNVPRRARLAARQGFRILGTTVLHVSDEMMHVMNIPLRARLARLAGAMAKRAARQGFIVVIV